MAKAKRTGPHATRFPLAGSTFHISRARNLPLAAIDEELALTRKLLASGECHADWGRKRLVALERMREAKERRLRS